MCSVVWAQISLDCVICMKRIFWKMQNIEIHKIQSWEFVHVAHLTYIYMYVIHKPDV